MINKYSNIPLYIQLKNHIVDKINNGEYVQESQIPSEQELCELYNISRPTVRQAISELTASGYLYKEKGKGTFVSKTKACIDVKNYTGFTDSIIDSNVPGEKDYISLKTIENTSFIKLNEIFSLQSSSSIEFAEAIYYTKSTGSVLAINTSFIPITLFPEIVSDIVSKKPSFEIMKGKYPLIPVKSKSSMDMIYTNHEEANFLQLQTGQPLIRVTNILYAKNGQVVEYIISKYRADKCRLHFENIK
jgi:DNA-binding GntR family transcriptional regulator